MTASTDPIIAPAWKKYKNRLKTIRQKYKGREMTAALKERKAKETAQARADYAAALPVETAAEFLKQSERRRNAIEIGQAYLEDGRPLADYDSADAGACDPYCIGARSRYCTCDCLGSNHGAANGLEPWQIISRQASIDLRIASGLLPPETRELRKAEREEKRRENPQWKKAENVNARTAA